jgi:hypothetical protein
MEIEMQKLEKRNTYTPTNTSLVCSSVISNVNKEETLSHTNLKTFSNNLEENLHQQTGGHKVVVFVLSKEKIPLMPCKPAKARHLLMDGKAKVVSCKPFTIQLLFDCENITQETTLGIDSGYKKIGFSAVTNKRELISGELTLRTDISKKLTERSMYRRNRRNKLWYRKPRFLNRAIPKGWLAPSIQHKIDSHIRLIDKIQSILPITKIIIEIAKFDTQKLQNIDIKDVEYQQGQMQDYDNLRAFILQRDNYICQICKKKEGIFDIHHIIQRKDGGSNRPNNLVCVHTKCHQEFHKSKIKHNFNKPKSFKQTPIMNNIRKYIVDKLECNYTFGYITKRKRKELELDKTHYNDAFVIAGGETQTRIQVIKSKLIRRNNRQLQQNRKGQKISIRKQRYKIQSGDIISFNNKKLICNGTFNIGKYVSFVKNIFGIRYTKIQDIKVLYYGKGIQL